MEPLSVLIYADGADTGGTGWRLVDAFRRHSPEWEVRAMAASARYMRYPVDLPYSVADARRRWRRADVVHLRNSPAALARFGAHPALVHHHGSTFRAHHGLLWRRCEAAGAVQAVSTLDLELLEPGLLWVPGPYDARALAALPGRPPDGRVVVAHAPTSRLVKSTEAVVAAVRALRARGLPVVLDLIEGRPWSETLARKARADVYVDQVGLGYGGNAVEAWLMGKPVVADTADPRVKEHMRATIGYLPFLEAGGEAGLVAAIGYLVEHPHAREEWGAVGHAYATRWHDGRESVARLAGAYHEAARRSPRTRKGLARA